MVASAGGRAFGKVPAQLDRFGKTLGGGLCLLCCAVGSSRFMRRAAVGSCASFIGPFTPLSLLPSTSPSPRSTGSSGEADDTDSGTERNSEIKAVWTVFGPPPDDRPPRRRAGGMEMLGVDDGLGEDMEEDGEVEPTGEELEEHALTILAMGGEEPTTEVLKGPGLENVDEDEGREFYMEGPTVVVANLFSCRRILQVTRTRLMLYRGLAKQHELPLIAGSQIVSAWVEDPYVALLLQDGRLKLVRGDPATLQLSFHQPPPSAAPLPERVTAAAITRLPLGLAGGGENNYAVAPGGWVLAVASEAAESSLCLYSLPDLALIYDAGPGAVLGSQLICDASCLTPDQLTAAQDLGEPVPFLLDILIQPMAAPATGPGRPGLCLVAITSLGDLLVYRSFYFPAPATAAATAAAKAETDSMPSGAGLGRRARDLRFRRVPHEVMLRGKDLWDDAFREEVDLADTSRRAALRAGPVRFPRLSQLRCDAAAAAAAAGGAVGGVEGVLVAGRQPAVVALGPRGAFVHPLRLDRGEGIRSAARFRTRDNGEGLIVVADKGRDKTKGMLKIVSLPNNVRLDSHWPVRVRHTGVTVHHLVYHAATGCHVAVVSYSVEMEDPDRRPEGVPDEPLPPVTEERYQLRLLAPYTLEELDVYDGFDFAAGERALCIQLVHLKNTRTPDVLLPYLAVGSGHVNGESEAARATGRIYIFDIVSVVGREGYEGRSTYALKRAFVSQDQQEIKGAISAVVQLEGYLLVAQGPNPGMIGGSKLYVYEWVDEKLVGRSFYDAHFYVTSIRTFKFFIIFGDARHGVHCLRWREDIKMLQLLAKDALPLNVMSVEFVTLGASLGFLASDTQRNFQLQVFAPNSPEYRRQQLLCRADFHLGAHVNKMMRWPMPFRPDLGVRIAAHYATLDGAFGAVAPLCEDSYRRLLALQNLLVTAIPQNAGLNPKSWRLYKPEFCMNRRYAKNTLDGTLLGRYLHLDLGLQIQLASATGNLRDILLGDLYDFIHGTLLS